jgi:trigger factor
VFTITLKELKARELPELDDDFAQEVSEFETLSALRESLETRFQKEAEQKTKESKQEALLNQLMEQLETELPETLIRQEVDYSVTQTAMQLGQQGLDIKKTFTQEIVAMLREQARPEALTRLKRTLVLGEVAKQESIKVEEEAVQAKVDELMAEYAGQEIDVNRLREVVEEDLLREKILGWLEAHNSIELVPEGSLKPAEPETSEEAVSETEPQATETQEPVVEAAIEAPAAAEATIEVEAVEVEAVTVAEEPEQPAEAPAANETAGKAKTTKAAKSEKSDKSETTGKSTKSETSTKKSKTSKQSS